MRFARYAFIAAGVWGIAVLTPLYFLFDVTGRAYAAPTEYPHFFYGFVSVAMVWQIAFLIIGSNPARFRPLMIPCMLEKFSYVATLAVLHSQSRISWTDAQTGVPDFLLGVLFVIAYVRSATPRQEKE